MKHKDIVVIIDIGILNNISKDTVAYWFFKYLKYRAPHIHIPDTRPISTEEYSTALPRLAYMENRLDSVLFPHLLTKSDTPNVTYEFKKDFLIVRITDV